MKHGQNTGAQGKGANLKFEKIKITAPKNFFHILFFSLP
jgi:hypothetical protein